MPGRTGLISIMEFLHISKRVLMSLASSANTTKRNSPNKKPLRFREKANQKFNHPIGPLKLFALRFRAAPPRAAAAELFLLLFYLRMISAHHSRLPHCAAR